MNEFKTLHRRTILATGATYAWLTISVIAAVATALDPNWEAEGSLAVPIFSLLELIMLVVSVILVGMWLYRASANAHARSANLTISPGWAVGWYFIPFANLVKPYESMKEIWFEANGDIEDGEAPSTIKWWWGLWLAMNVTSNASWRLESVDLGLASAFQLAAAVCSVPLTILLARLMRQVENGQTSSSLERVFT